MDLVTRLSFGLHKQEVCMYPSNKIICYNNGKMTTVSFVS